MVTICWACKGGSGTTVVAASIALSHPTGSLLVDLDGELPAVLGLDEPDRPGVADWLASDTDPARLDDLLGDVDRRHRILPWRAGPALDAVHHDARAMRSQVTDDRWSLLGSWLADREDGATALAVVDAGTGVPPDALVAHATRSLLVIRPCYLAVRRAVAAQCRPSGVVLVDEPGRGLRAADIEHAIGAPVEATLRLDPAVARAVDAGLLTARVPRTVRRELRRVAA